MAAKYGISEYPNTFKRQSSFALDMTSIWNSYADAEKYAATNPVAYELQPITIKDGENIRLCILKEASSGSTITIDGVEYNKKYELIDVTDFATQKVGTWSIFKNNNKSTILFDILYPIEADEYKIYTSTITTGYILTDETCNLNSDDVNLDSDNKIYIEFFKQVVSDTNEITHVSILKTELKSIYINDALNFIIGTLHLVDTIQNIGVDYSTLYEYEIKNDKAVISKYIGNETDINVPTNIDGKDTIINGDNTFMESTASTINLQNIPFINNTMTNTFYYSGNLNEVTGISPNITSMTHTYKFCSNLKTTPYIPDSVTDLSYAFYECIKLTSSITIPNSVSNMAYTFSACTNLSSAPNMPTSVQDLSHTFETCVNLVSAPIIPNNVTNMYQTFARCDKLTGDIVINSEHISNFTNCFIGTNTAKNVYIPYKYENGTYTETYNTAFNTTTGINGKNGVTLHDLTELS